jgi:hypothetical protein
MVSWKAESETLGSGTIRARLLVSAIGTMRIPVRSKAIFENTGKIKSCFMDTGMF